MLNWHFESNMAFAMKGGRFYPRNTLKCIDMFSKHFDVWHFGSHTIPSPTCNVCYNISANGTPPGDGASAIMAITYVYPISHCSYLTLCRRRC